MDKLLDVQNKEPVHVEELVAVENGFAELIGQVGGGKAKGCRK